MRRATVAALAAAPIIALTSSCGSSWPHAWCGPVEDTLHHGSSPDAIMAALQSEQDKHGAPVGQLVTDYRNAAAAMAAQDTTPVSGTLDFLAEEKQALYTIKADVEEVNQSCGKPKDWETDTVHVPSSST